MKKMTSFLKTIIKESLLQKSEIRLHKKHSIFSIFPLFKYFHNSSFTQQLPCTEIMDAQLFIASIETTCNVKKITIVSSLASCIKCKWTKGTECRSTEFHSFLHAKHGATSPLRVKMHNVIL